MLVGGRSDPNDGTLVIGPVERESSISTNPIELFCPMEVSGDSIVAVNIPTNLSRI